MKMRKKLLIVSLLFLLGGCGSESQFSSGFNVKDQPLPGNQVSDSFQRDHFSLRLYTFLMLNFLLGI